MVPALPDSKARHYQHGDTCEHCKEEPLWQRHLNAIRRPVSDADYCYRDRDEEQEDAKILVFCCPQMLIPLGEE
jgi:hypothetical protein